MTQEEAIRLLEQELEGFRREPYPDLAHRIDGGSLNYERLGPAGKRYQVEVLFLWDSRPGGNVRVMGSIDDGGWRALMPVTRSFIKSADGSFVSE